MQPIAMNRGLQIVEPAGVVLLAGMGLLVTPAIRGLDFRAFPPFSLSHPLLHPVTTPAFAH